MADQRTMAELLCAPTEGYAEAIVVPPILVEQFELKHSLINMMTSDQFFGLEKENHHDHIRCVVTTAMTDILKQFQGTPPPASVKAVEEICVTCGGAHPCYQCLAAGGNTFLELRDNIQGYVSAAAVNYNQGPLPSNTISNPNRELKAITTRSGIVFYGPSVPIPPPFINPEEDERVEETLTDQDLAEYTIKKMLKALLSNKEKLLEIANTPLNENCSAVILKKLTEKLRDPGKFLIPYGFTNFVIVDCESDPRVPLILERPFLRTAHALIDAHGEEMILRDGDERLTLNLIHNTSSYSNQPQKESINMINIFNDLSEDFLENLFVTNHQSGNPIFSLHSELTSPKVKDDIFDPEGGNVLIEKVINLDSTKDPPPYNVNPLSGGTTSSSSLNHLLEEFANELAEMDSILEDLVDEDNLADLNDNLADTMPEMFIDEHALDYSCPLLYDEYDNDLFEVESDTEYVYDDPFDSKGEKIKESKLLINELDPPRSSDFLPSSEYDSFLFEDFSKVDALPSTDNKDKVFNLGILIQKNLSEFNTCVAPDKNVKKIDISYASLILEDFNLPLYELPFLKEVPGFETLLLFSFKNEEKFSNLGF
uniref:Reverse transcriptase domain-containing protein n=1 Tax=Tanacetum cinerariifolium TaxID=118510 RepID=A0A6L2MMD3_TANCI|nr:hypothetical protein [Tanacetum cinerariifolium]